MKRRFTEEQIISVLKSQEKGMTVLEICRKQAIAEQTIYRWRSKYGSMEVNEAKKLRQVEDEIAGSSNWLES